MAEKQKTKKLVILDCKILNEDTFDELLRNGINTKKQKTCLTEKEGDNLIHEITKLFEKGKYNTSKEDYPDSDAEQSYFAMKELVKETEKAIMKKVVPKEKHDKAIYNWRYRCGELEEENTLLKSQLCDYDKLKDEFREYRMKMAKGYRQVMTGVTKEEHDKLKDRIEYLENTCDWWIKKVRCFEDALKQDSFKTISGEEFIRKENIIQKEKVRAYMIENYEFTLNEFIEDERDKSRMGSGDDMWYEQQIIDYINKQRPIWIEFMKFIEARCKKELLGEN